MDIGFDEMLYVAVRKYEKENDCSVEPSATPEENVMVMAVKLMKARDPHWRARIAWTMLALSDIDVEYDFDEEK